MNRKEMLQEIQKEMSDKTLKFGCKCISKAYGEVIITEIFDCINDDTPSYKLGDKLPGGENLYFRYKRWSGNVGIDDIEEIIGSPVIIGDILEYIYIRKTELLSKEDINDLTLYWVYLRKPIESQSEQCIKYVYSLIQSEK